MFGGGLPTLDGLDAHAFLENHVAWLQPTRYEGEVGGGSVGPTLAPLLLYLVLGSLQLVEQRRVVEGEDRNAFALRPRLDSAAAGLLDDVRVGPVEQLGHLPEVSSIELFLSGEDGVGCGPLQRLAVEGVCAIPDYIAGPDRLLALWDHEGGHVWEVSAVLASVAQHTLRHAHGVSRLVEPSLNPLVDPGQIEVFDSDLARRPPRFKLVWKGGVGDGFWGGVRCLEWGTRRLTLPLSFWVRVWRVKPVWDWCSPQHIILLGG